MNQTKQTTYKRRNYLINPKFQIRFAFYISTWILALSSIFPLLLNQTFTLLADQVTSLPGGPEIQQIMEAKKQLLVGLITIEAVFFCVVAALSIFVSHRIAGPIYKLNEYLKEGARTGELKPDLHFRADDHFKEVAENYNAMVAAVSQKSRSAD